MPTFDTPNSTQTYTLSIPATVEVFGAGGGDGRGPDGESGGRGGYAKVEVDSGTTLVIEIGSGGNAPAGGPSPAGDGGDGGSFWGNDSAGGGGGGATVVTRQSDGVELVAAGGGGGGGGWDGDFESQRGGGGGARGGAGGQAYAKDGADAAGAGVGGDGADGTPDTGFGVGSGGAGGATTGGGVTVIETTDGGGSAGDGEVVVQFPDVSPPDNVSQTVVNDGEIDVSWASVSGAEYDVEVSVDGSAFEAVTTTSDESITYSAGEANKHQFRVRATNPDNTSDWVLTETVATDPSNLVATGGTFDPVDLSWDAAPDATEYRVLRAPTSGTAVSDYTEIATATTESYADDADPSTKHHYRIQAVYAGGADSALSNEATARRKGLLADVQDETTVELGWQAHADSTGGWLVEQRREYGSEFSAWREVTTTGPAVKQYTAGTSPDTTTQFRVTALTSRPSTGAYGDGTFGDGLYPVATDAESPGTAVATTDALGLAPRGVQASGWHVEIERPDGEGTVEPTILADVEASPRLNGTPEVTIPVPRAAKWLDEEWERQPMRVWRDGERLPIEQLSDPRIARGSGGDYVELVGRGGTSLSARYQDEVRDRSAHNVMRDVLEASGYAYTVDPAPATDGESFGTLSNRADFRNYAEINELTDPIDVGFDTLEPRRTSVMTPLPEIESAGVGIVNDSTVNWTASNAVEFDVGEQRSSEWTFETDYRIPGEHVGVWFRASYNYDGFLLIYLDGQKIGSIARQTADESDKSVEWKEISDLVGSRTVDEIDDLDPGQHTLRVEASGSDPSIPTQLGPEGSMYLDMPAVVDEREWDPSTFANTLDSNERLDGPPGVYSPQTIDFRIQPIQRATGATLDATVSDTTNEQAVGVGPIETDVQAAANATTIDRDFASSTRDFIARVVIGGADAGQGDSPNDGVETWYTNYRTVPQSLSELAIEYDALGSPSISESIDDPIQEVLVSKAKRANCIWEVQWDADLEEPRIIVTQVGQRTSDANPDIAEYEVTKDLSRELSGATVYGKSQDTQGEGFTGSLSGTDLANDRIEANSERVYAPDGTEFESVEASGDETVGDYEMAYQEGRLSITDDGAMTAGQDYLIDYSWQPVGSTERDVGFANHRVETLNAIRSDAGAAGAASFILDELDSPQWEAEVTIPQREAGFALVDAIAPSQLPSPGDERFEIRSIDEGAGEISLTLGARLSAGEVIDQIERSLSETAREV